MSRSLFLIPTISWFLKPCSLTLPSAVLTSPPLSPSQVFNQAAFQAKNPRELTDAMVDFMDCSIVIPPTEIQNETMLSSIISFQKKLLQDRFQASDPTLRLDSKPRRGECYKYIPKTAESLCSTHINKLNICSSGFVLYHL